MSKLIVTDPSGKIVYDHPMNDSVALQLSQFVSMHETQLQLLGERFSTYTLEDWRQAFEWELTLLPADTIGVMQRMASYAFMALMFGVRT